jgi:hypothetical protein
MTRSSRPVSVDSAVRYGQKNDNLLKTFSPRSSFIVPDLVANWLLRNNSSSFIRQHIGLVLKALRQNDLC